MIKPNFLICGAAKSGSTALYNVISRHKNICMSIPKEPNFFRRNFDKGEEWYSKCFDHYEGENLVGEASVSNMVDTEITIERIKDFLGDKNIKFLFILRNPVERVYSDYFASVKTGKMRHEDGKFSNFIRGKVKKRDPHTTKYHHERVLKRSRYSTQVSVFIKEFGKKNVHIIISKDFLRNTEKEANKALSFLGESDLFDRVGKVKSNEGKYPNEIYEMTLDIRKKMNKYIPNRVKKETSKLRKQVKKILLTGNRPEMKKSDRKFLSDKYEEDIEFVEKIVGRELDEWRQGKS